MTKRVAPNLTVAELEKLIGEDKKARKRMHQEHSALRMLQRYGRYFTTSDQRKIIDLIKKSNDRYLVTQTEVYKEGIYRVPYKRDWIYLVYNDHIRSVITVLPENNKYKMLYEETMVKRENEFFQRSLPQKPDQQEKKGGLTFSLDVNKKKRGPLTFNIGKSQSIKEPLTFSPKYKTSKRK